MLTAIWRCLTRCYSTPKEEKPEINVTTKLNSKPQLCAVSITESPQYHAISSAHVVLLLGRPFCFNGLWHKIHNLSTSLVRLMKAAENTAYTRLRVQGRESPWGTKHMQNHPFLQAPSLYACNICSFTPAMFYFIYQSLLTMKWTVPCRLSERNAVLTSSWIELGTWHQLTVCRMSMVRNRTPDLFSFPSAEQI